MIGENPDARLVRQMTSLTATTSQSTAKSQPVTSRRAETPKTKSASAVPESAPGRPDYSAILATANIEIRRLEKALGKCRIQNESLKLASQRRT